MRTARRHIPGADPGHHGGVTVRPSATPRRVRLVLLSILSVSALLCGIVAMHAQMAGADTSSGAMPVSAMDRHAGDVISSTVLGTATDVMQHGMGGMAAMDCLLLGMMCLFGVGALLLLILAGKLRSLLRRLLAIRARTAVGWLRPPDPPSLLVLSISRT
jgi:hypothetical protein